MKPVTLLAQQKAKVKITHRAERHYLSRKCYQTIRWDAVHLPDTNLSRKINNLVRQEARADRIDDEATEFCNGEMEYDQECYLAFVQLPILSYYLTTFEYYKGAPHGSRKFRTLNIDARNGKRIHFHDLFLSHKIQALDSFIIYRLDSQLVHFGGGRSEEWLEQLPDLQFNINENGISVLFAGSAYVLSIIELNLTYEELSPYIDPKGLLANRIRKKTVRAN